MIGQRLLQFGIGAGPVAAGLLALGIGLGAPATAQACYCVYPELEGSIDSADVIFEGIAPSDPTALEKDIGLGAYGDVHTNRYEFEVLRYFKSGSGVGLPPQLDLHTPTQLPACGRQFDKAQVYLIYARQRADGSLTDFRCSRTRSVEAAAEDLVELGDGTPPDESLLAPLREPALAAEPVLGESSLGGSSDVRAGAAGCTLTAPRGAADPYGSAALPAVLLGSVLALSRRRRP